MKIKYLVRVELDQEYEITAESEKEAIEEAKEKADFDMAVETEEIKQERPNKFIDTYVFLGKLLFIIDNFERDICLCYKLEGKYIILMSAKNIPTLKEIFIESVEKHKTTLEYIKEYSEARLKANSNVLELETLDKEQINKLNKGAEAMRTKGQGGKE